jgi:hypothetical protein
MISHNINNIGTIVYMTAISLLMVDSTTSEHLCYNKRIILPWTYSQKPIVSKLQVSSLDSHSVTGEDKELSTPNG